jgi:hypothetical protein
MLHSLKYADLDHGLFVGSCPKGPEDVLHLKQDLSMDAIVNLQTEEDFRALGINWQFLWTALMRTGLEAVRVPIRDLDNEDLARGLGEAVEAVAERLGWGSRVYLHCTAGINRSPTVAIAALAGPRGMGLSAAHEHVRGRRKVVPEMGIIRDWMATAYPSLLD